MAIGTPDLKEICTKTNHTSYGNHYSKYTCKFCDKSYDSNRYYHDEAIKNIRRHVRTKHRADYGTYVINEEPEFSLA